MGSALVGQSGNQWMIWANKKGAGSPECRMLNHLNMVALDQLAPTQLAIPASFKIPENLTCVEYPKHMEERYIKRLSRQQKLGQAAQPKAGGKGKGKAKGGGGRVPTLLEPAHTTLLDKLYNIPMPNEVLQSVSIDVHLRCNRWPRENQDVRKHTAGYDVDCYKKKWAAIYEEYMRGWMKLKDARGGGDEEIPEGDPRWELHRELVANAREKLKVSHSRSCNPPFNTLLISLHSLHTSPSSLSLLQGTYNDIEFYLYPSQELYAECAAMLEVCYEKARNSLHSNSGEAGGSSEAAAPPRTQKFGVSTGAIKFPWRIAGKLLNEMKKKMVELEKAGGL